MNGTRADAAGLGRDRPLRHAMTGLNSPGGRESVEERTRRSSVKGNTDAAQTQTRQNSDVTQTMAQIDMRVARI